MGSDFGPSNEVRSRESSGAAGPESACERGQPGLSSVKEDGPNQGSSSRDISQYKYQMISDTEKRLRLQLRAVVGGRCQLERVEIRIRTNGRSTRLTMDRATSLLSGGGRD